MKNATMDKLFKGIDYLTGILTGLMVLFVFMNVVLRTCFNSGLTWSEELSRYLFVFVTYVGAISAMRVNGHLGVDTLISRVPRPLQMVMYVVSQLVIAALMCILVHGSGKMVLQNTESRTAALGISYALLYSVGIITGVSMMLLFLLAISAWNGSLGQLTGVKWSMVSMTTDEDEIMAETGSEDLSDEEYAKRLNEEGGK
mgnify:CR=1 FL=1